MADENEEKNEPEEGEDKPKKSKKGLFLIGGIVGLVGLAYMASLMAVPALPEAKSLEGPFVADLSTADLQVNLAGEGNKRFLVMKLKAGYDAYDELYFTTRVADPLYEATLKDALIALASQKTREEVTDSISKEILKEEIRQAVDPIIFPVHVGVESLPYGAHEESGIAPGYSVVMSTLRGLIYDHVLHVDGAASTIALDDGPPFEFTGQETDLVVANSKQETVHLDLTGFVEGFTGEVNVGVNGRVRNVFFDNFLVQ